nr:GntR family transcriptional regulator [uncultured Mediterraneibacter sp.]
MNSYKRQGKEMAPYGNIPTKDFIIETIKNEILSGKMEPGTELAQEALAERLGVSRMPIREALQNLVQEGFAVRLPNRHMQAVVLNAEQIHDVFRMTSLLVAENTILLMKKEKGREKDISVLDFLDRPADEQLDQILNGMENAPDVKRMAEWEILFHERLISLLENPYLEQMQMKSLQGYVTYAIEHLGDKKAIVQQLRKVTEAMRTDDSDQVREAYDEYYTTYAEAYVALREKAARELAEEKQDAESETATEVRNESVESEIKEEKTPAAVTVTPQVSDWDEDSDKVSRKAETEKQVEEITADEVSKFLM